MNNNEIPEAPDWTPDNPHRQQPIAPDLTASVAASATGPTSGPVADLRRAAQRRWLAPVAAIAAALLVGTVSGVAGSAVIAAQNDQPASTSGISAPLAGSDSADALPGPEELDGD